MNHAKLRDRVIAIRSLICLGTYLGTLALLGVPASTRPQPPTNPTAW